MINVTRPFLPPIEEYQKYLQEIWKREWLTNNGPLVNELELKLKEYLDVPHLLYMSNGTIALQIAIKALGLKGGIITTPFSYVATTSSIVWEGCRPVFVDIDAQSLNIDPDKIEEAITKNTSAILATHVFGNPCDIEKIQAIATRHSLPVIYDAAHCFGTRYKGKSVFHFGTISTASFHATKLYHTVEGGAVFTSSSELLKKMAFMRNFGHNGPENFAEVGINGKNSEFHAAMGLVNLQYVHQIINRRKLLTEYYNQKLDRLNLERPKVGVEVEYNYAYYPVLFPDKQNLLLVIQQLELNKIFPRRYFYPPLTSLSYLNKKEMPITSSVTDRILCLPLYYDLSIEEIDFIARVIIRSLTYGISK